VLSLWRAYGQDHGYALEIARDSLETALTAVSTYPPATGLVKVRYGHVAADDAIAQAVKEVASFSRNMTHPGVKGHYAAIALNALLAGIKHPGFAEEKEWRLVVGLELFDEAAYPPTNRKETRFRPTPMAIIPYIELPLDRTGIVGIRVGPGENVDVREASVRRLLKTLGMGNTEVTRSDVPLRS
jgi:hypothetical protein